ncbi:organic cation transporter protein-like isoform X2 [Choristoneura fumiferana]|uniref:organic cation transporter protein-like isoform X2 n=1 Tax=Choristoneura fumiferana TaxID=7141 RepID=UPI003D1565A1
MSESLLNGINLDKVLDRFNIFGRYHAISAVCITLSFIYNAIKVTNYIFVAEDIRYSSVLRCADINDTRGVAKESWNVSKVDDTTTLCGVAETCTQWIYDNPDSFVAELACQDWKRTLVGTVHNFGYMIGLIIIGPLSDKFGRKPLAILAGVTSGVCGLAKSFASTYWIYIVFEFLEAAFGEIHSPLFMLAIEMVSTKSRVKYTMICTLGFPIGGVLFPLIYWLISYWRTFLRVLYASGLLFILAFFFLDESPRWHLTKGHIEAAVKILNKAAKINKVEIEESLEMLTYEKDDSSNFTTAITDTFKSRALLKSCLACMVWWIVAVFANYGLSINSVSLNGDKYVNYALSAAVQVPSFVITTCLMDKFNRKVVLMWSFVACGVLCVSQPFIPNNLFWLSILMYMMGKLISCMFSEVIYFFTSELFPTYTRNSMHALCSSVGRIGGIAAPLTPLLMVYWPGLPTLLFGVASLIGGLVTIIVPETGKKPLPDTVLQAEALSNTRQNDFEERQTSSRIMD